jgi:hypothetical protein
MNFIIPTIKVTLFTLLLSSIIIVSSSITQSETSFDILKFEFSKSEAQPDEIIHIILHLDMHIALEWGEFSLAVIDSDTNETFYDVRRVYSSLFVSENSIAFELPEFVRNGIYFIEHFYIYSPEYHSGYIYKLNGTDYISPTIKIFGATPDITPPILHDIYFDKETAGPEEIVNLYFSVSDNQSGFLFGNAAIGYFDQTYEYYRSIYWVSVHTEDKITENLYSTSFTVNKYWPNTTLEIIEVGLGDWAYNYWSGSVGIDYNATGILIQGTTPDLVPPVVKSVSTTQDVFYSSYDNNTIILEIEEEGSGMKDLFLQFNSNETDNHAFGSGIDIGWNGIWNGTHVIGNFHIPEWLPNGTYYLGFVHLGDRAGNQNWVHYDDFNKLEINIEKLPTAKVIFNKILPEIVSINDVLEIDIQIDWLSAVFDLHVEIQVYHPSEDYYSHFYYSLEDKGLNNFSTSIFVKDLNPSNNSVISIVTFEFYSGFWRYHQLRSGDHFNVNNIIVIDSEPDISDKDPTTERPITNDTETQNDTDNSTPAVPPNPLIGFDLVVASVALIIILPIVKRKIKISN